MDTVAKLPSRQIMDIVQPTFGAYLALQLARRAEIEARPSTEHAYGPHERQKLDVYLPSALPKDGKKLPCIVFFYGGGFVQGAKQLPFAQGVMYQNVGAYFSDQGFVTVIPDYRLFGQHGAQYPSGGEDVGLALDWVNKNLDIADKDKIFVIGSSAGGVHTATYLYSPDLPSIPRTPLRGVVFAQVPFRYEWTENNAMQTPVVDGYFGGPGKYKELQPYSLRQKSKDTTETAVLLAEYESPDEIEQPTRDFLELQVDGVGRPELLPELKGHNHISTFLSLGLGGQEDEWIVPTLEWIKARC